MKRHALTWILSSAVIGTSLMATGCSSEPKQTNNEAAAERWNQARSGVLYALAQDQFEMGNFEKARKTISEALTLNPMSVPVHLLSARLSIEQGRLEDAQASLLQATTINPKAAEAYYLAGVVAQRWLRTSEALQHYEQAAEIDPSEQAYLLARVEMLVELNRVPEAVKLLEERVVFFENSAGVRDALGQLYLQQGNSARAVDMLRQASVLAGDDPEIHQRLATALMRDGKWDYARLTLRRLLKRDDLADRPDLHMAIGECEMQLGGWLEARGHFETATRLRPNQPNAWLGLAKAAIKLRDHRRAELSLAKARALSPLDAEVHLLNGYLRLEQRRLSDALSSFRRATELDPNDGTALCMVGYVLEKSGQGDRAIHYYGRALGLDPKDELAARLLASVDTGE